MKTLTVQGKGHVKLEPDLCIIKFIVSEHQWEYDECMLLLNEKVALLRKTLAGIDKKIKLKTTDFRIDVDTKYVKNESVFNGYDGVHKLKIELPVDKILINKVLKEVTPIKSKPKIDISFSVSDTEKLHDLVLEKAVRVAVRNAEIIAKTAQIRLGSIVDISYGWNELRIESMSYEIREECLSYGPDIEPDDIKVDETVTLKYEILT
ncbi:MAG: SIMPL domain-containing protein [bacterium]|nr:SIMPL domain-containing protein [bacterium]